MDASQQQQDVLSQGEGTSSVDRSASLRLPGSTESYSLSVLQQAPESNEGAEGADVDVTDADSVSTWTNEVLTGGKPLMRPALVRTSQVWSVLKGSVSSVVVTGASSSSSSSLWS